MPQGKCSANFQSDNIPLSGSGRVARVTISVRGVERQLHLAGMANSVFPDRMQMPVPDLRPGESLNMVWEDSLFFGRDLLLGDVLATLDPNQALPQSTGSIRSLAPAVSPEVSFSDEYDFFPAINRNEFFWRLELPRQRAIYTSNAALVNEAVIKSIPPIGSVYSLTESILFEASQSNPGLNRFIAPNLVIKTCDVQLRVLGGMSATIELNSEDGDTVTFSATIQNETQQTEIEATWLVWPRPPIEDYTSWMGTQIIRRNRTTELQMTLPRDIFFRSRWFVVSLARPFEENGMAAVRFPELS